LFFEQGTPTKEIWYYELLPPDDRKKYSKTRPIQAEEFAPVKDWWINRIENENAWKVSKENIFKENKSTNTLSINLDQKNPNRKGEFEYREPAALIASIVEKEEKVSILINEIKILLESDNQNKL
jgi:type I restriction enzyme M protein